MSTTKFYKGYRQNLVKQILNFLNTGESFKVTGQSGVGKSSFLNYLATNKQIKAKLQKQNIQLAIIDLNKIYKTTSNSFIKAICSQLGVKGTSINSLNKYLNKHTKQKKVYIIIDHCENLQNFSEKTIKIIRAFRDKYKYKFGLILSFEKSNKVNTKKLQPLLKVAAIEITVNPLLKAETITNINHFAKLQNIQLKNNEVLKIAKLSRGYPKLIKQLLSHKVAGVEIDKAIVSIQSLNAGIGGNNDYFLETALKQMTRAEYLFFSELYTNIGKVITRDKFATLLSPKSEGVGVSNEAIDQCISRVRRQIKKLEFPFTLKTQRGIGYYLA